MANLSCRGSSCIVLRRSFVYAVLYVFFVELFRGARAGVFWFVIFEVLGRVSFVVRRFIFSCAFFRI